MFRDAQLVYARGYPLEHVSSLAVEDELVLTDCLSGAVWLGGQFAARDLPRLGKRGITHVLSCNGRQPFLFGSGIQGLVIDWDDDVAESLAPHIYAAVEYIKKCVLERGSILVHCTAGKSRSVAAVCAFLISCCGNSYGEAIEHVRAVRRWAEPNSSFARQLTEFACSHKGIHSHLCTSRSCDLCHLEKKTTWYEEHNDFVVIECDQCDQPMVVWRYHAMDVPQHDVDAMVKALTRVADSILEGEYYIDKRQRSISNHLHFHARSGKNPWNMYESLRNKL